MESLANTLQGVLYFVESEPPFDLDFELAGQLGDAREVFPFWNILGLAQEEFPFLLRPTHFSGG